MADQKSNLIRVGGLWTNHGQSGDHLSGSFGQAKILIFENTRRNDDNEPTHVMFMAANEKREDAGGEARPATRPARANDAPRTTRAGYVPCSEPDGSLDEGSIPF